MLEIKNVCKKYKNKYVLNNITINFNSGKLYALYGINGSGKSTLLKLLAGVIYKSKGDINKDSIISYLPDKFSFPSFMRVKEFIKVTLKLYKSNLNPIDVMDRFRLENKLISSLSKGNLQKLGLFQIFYNDTDYYLLDEPVDGLDDFAKKLFKELVNEKLKENKTVIVSIHSKTFLNDLNAISYEIKEGRINERKRKKLQSPSVI